ncbi:MAG: hypothetical protein GC145_14575 [Caulobacter sp.]|nr:hypothetical protein [Caulobacter sp.]
MAKPRATSPYFTLAELLHYQGQLRFECAACGRCATKDPLDASLIFGEDAGASDVAKRSFCGGCGASGPPIKVTFDFDSRYVDQNRLREVRRRLAADSRDGGRRP